MNRPNSSPTRNRRAGDTMNNHNSNSSTNHEQQQQHQQQQHQQQQQRTAKMALSNINKVLHTAPSLQKHDAQSERSKRLAKELEDFVERGMKGVLATERGEDGAPSIDAATELQIQIARMFRQVRSLYAVLLLVVCSVLLLPACLVTLNSLYSAVQRITTTTTVADITILLCTTCKHQNIKK